MGLLFLFASITYLFKLITPPELTGAMKTFNAGIKASGYLMPTGKDGNPLNEVRILCNSIMNNNGIMSKDKTIRLNPEKSVLIFKI